MNMCFELAIFMHGVRLEYVNGQIEQNAASSRAQLIARGDNAVAGECFYIIRAMPIDMLESNVYLMERNFMIAVTMALSHNQSSYGCHYTIFMSTLFYARMAIDEKKLRALKVGAL